MIHVYTGNGKGKTTAALGLCLRASGHGKKSIIIQFMKSFENRYGEHEAVKKLFPLITIEPYGMPTFVIKDNLKKEDIELAQKGFLRAKEAISSKEYDIVVLDELNVAIYFDLVKLSEVLDMIKEVPKEIEVVITGRYAPGELIEKADLVTEMKEVKHYYTQGQPARKGIEF